MLRKTVAGRRAGGRTCRYFVVRYKTNKDNAVQELAKACRTLYWQRRPRGRAGVFNARKDSVARRIWLDGCRTSNSGTAIRVDYRVEDMQEDFRSCPPWALSLTAILLFQLYRDGPSGYRRWNSFDFLSIYHTFGSVQWVNCTWIAVSCTSQPCPRLQSNCVLPAQRAYQRYIL